jgi:hypothetical protein
MNDTKTIEIKKANYDRVCLLCGEPLKHSWDDWEQSYYCDCKYTLKNNEINNKIEHFKKEIRQLEKEIILPKYTVFNGYVLKLKDFHD